MMRVISHQDAVAIACSMADFTDDSLDRIGLDLSPVVAGIGKVGRCLLAVKAVTIPEDSKVLRYRRRGNVDRAIKTCT
jgi:hypothetical protein